MCQFLHEEGLQPLVEDDFDLSIAEQWNPTWVELLESLCQGTAHDLVMIGQHLFVVADPLFLLIIHPIQYNPKMPLCVENIDEVLAIGRDVDRVNWVGAQIELCDCFD